MWVYMSVISLGIQVTVDILYESLIVAVLKAAVTIIFLY